MVNQFLNQELTELYNLTKVLKTRQYLYMCIYIYAASIQLGTFAVFFSRYCD